MRPPRCHMHMPQHPTCSRHHGAERAGAAIPHRPFFCHTRPRSKAIACVLHRMAAADAYCSEQPQASGSKVHRLIPWHRRSISEHASQSKRNTALAASDRPDEASDTSQSTPRGGMPDQKTASGGAISRPSAAAETASDGGPSKSSSRFSAVAGPLLVLGVACLWGTNPIALRYLYKTDGAIPLLWCLLSPPPNSASLPL